MPELSYAFMRTGIRATREKHIDWTDVSHDQRWFIGGQLDADGCCVRVCPVNGIMVRITKAENAWHLLEWLQRKLAGAIYKSRKPENEQQQPQKEWCVRGQAALDFCETIRHHAFLKRNQLEKALEFPLYASFISYLDPVMWTGADGETRPFPSIRMAAEDEKVTWITMRKRVDRGCGWERLQNPFTRDWARGKTAELDTILSEMKRTEDSPITAVLPYAYMGGFIEGDGCLSVGCVTISQKYRAICDAFMEHYGGRVSRREREPYPFHTWTVCGETSRRCLRDVTPHLVEKAEQARLILAAKRGEKRQVDEAVSKLKGNQGKKRRTTEQ